MTVNFPIEDAARAYRQRYDLEVRTLSRKTVAALRAIAMAPKSPEAQAWVSRLAKADLITEIISDTFPVAMLNETTHVLYHQDSPGWTACEWCHPHGGAPCECRLAGS